MKISRNELRRMILETILSGERNDLLIDKQLVEQASPAPKTPAKTNTAEKKEKNRRYTKSNQWINR